MTQLVAGRARPLSPFGGKPSTQLVNMGRQFSLALARALPAPRSWVMNAAPQPPARARAMTNGTVLAVARP